MIKDILSLIGPQVKIRRNKGCSFRVDMLDWDVPEAVSLSKSFFGNVRKGKEIGHVDHAVHAAPGNPLQKRLPTPGVALAV